MLSSSHRHPRTHAIPRLKRWRWKIWTPILVLLAFFFYGVFAYTSLGALTDLPLTRLMGFPFSGKSYFLIFQNDAERRPTGGFISAYGILHFRLGFFPTLTFGNVYDAKLIQPGTTFPDPDVAKLLAGPNYPGHGFRDGNSDPDFPTSAKELMRLYKLGYPDEAFDGVIALDFTAFAHLLDAVAGVTLDGKTFRGDGLFFALEQAIQDIDVHDPLALANRKDILGSLASRLIRKIIFSPTYYSAIAESLVASLDEKHVQFFFSDSELERVVREQAWAGALPQIQNADSLAVIEGNYGGMKASRYVTRSLEYEVELSEGRGAEKLTSNNEQLTNQDLDFKNSQIPNSNSETSNPDSEIPNTKYQILNTNLTATAHLTLRLAHRGDDAAPISGYYKSLWRVYAPLGSELVSGRPLRSFSDGAHQIFVFFVDMNPGETREIKLAYRLPDFVLTNNSYQLALVKPAGSTNDPVSVSVKAPNGYLFESPKSKVQSPKSDSEMPNTKYQIPDTDFDLRENLAVWNGVLARDVNLALSILPDTTPPRLANQEFVGGLTTIDLHFAEPLAPASLARATFTLTDLNQRDHVTDDVQITRVKLSSPQTLRLTVSGVSEVCREWYRLTFSGVTDTHGNTIQQKTVTVVTSLNVAGERCEERNK